MPIISVVIPIYKAEKYLDRCIESVLQQTFADFEVILVEDGSPDNCGILCDEWGAKDSRIRVFHRKNHGANASRAFGVSQSMGKYIKFVDADDTMPHDALELLKNKMETYQLDIVQGASTFHSSDTKTEYSYLGKTGIISGMEFCRALFSAQSHGGPWASLYKKSLFDDKTFALEPIIKLNEDKYMNLCLGTKAKKVGLFNDIVIYNYYLNNSSVTHNYVYKNTLPFALLYNHMEEVLVDSNMMKDIREDYLRSKLFVAISCVFHNKKLLQDTWVKNVYSETKDVPCPAQLKMLRLMLKRPILYPFFSAANNIRRFLNKQHKNALS